jgi:hypothetical protein
MHSLFSHSYYTKQTLHSMIVDRLWSDKVAYATGYSVTNFHNACTNKCPVSLLQA